MGRDDVAAGVGAAPVLRPLLPALAVRATGGVDIDGGIAPRLIERLGAPDFGPAFASEGRLSDLLAGVPARVVTEPNVGLFGAAGAEHL